MNSPLLQQSPYPTGRSAAHKKGLPQHGPPSEFLWADYFKDPSQWWDIRKTKTDPRTPDFKHKTTRDSLWIDGWYNPHWVQQEIRKRGLRPSLSVEEREDIMLEEMDARRRQHRTYQNEALIPKVYKNSEDNNNVAITLIASLKACAKSKDMQRGRKIHDDVLKQGLLESNIYIATTLVSMYVQCGAFEKAEEVFDAIPVKNVVVWNALIAGYAQNGRGKEAWSCFEKMQLVGISPDAVTFACTLKACATMGALERGQQLHAEIAQGSLLRVDIVVASALIDMYGKCGELERAEAVFDELPIKGVVSWNALIAVYAQKGHSKKALTRFEQMRHEGYSPDAITFACALKACGSLGAIDKGDEIHALIMRTGLMEEETLVGNALADMYAKCGALTKAQEVFDQLPVRDIVSWTALVSGYEMNDHSEEAIDCFERMRLEGIGPNEVTFACVLKACGNIGALDRGQDIHMQIVKERIPDEYPMVCTALLDMYANCGMLAEAQYMFSKLPARDVVSWSALMLGFAQLGEDEVILDLFNRMVKEGIKPNFVVFTLILTTCSHRGVVDKAQMYFELITKEYGIIPTLEHLTCMLDLYGRAGHLDKAAEMIIKMPLSADLTMWLTLLAACQKWGYVELGRWAYDHAIELDEENSAAYSCMHNLYAAVGRLADAHKVEALRKRGRGRR